MIPPVYVEPVVIAMLISRAGWRETLNSLVQQENIGHQYLFVVDNKRITEKQIQVQLKRYDKQPNFVVVNSALPPLVNASFDLRRTRIKDLYVLLQDLVRQQGIYDRVFLTEDDTVHAWDTIEHFQREDTGTPMSGIQVARHGTPSIGAWRRTSDDLIQTIPNDPTISHVDATGLYCLYLPTPHLLGYEFSRYIQLPADINSTLYDTHKIQLLWENKTIHMNGKVKYRVQPNVPLTTYRLSDWSFTDATPY